MKTGNSELGVFLSETAQSCSGRTSLSLGAALPTTLGLPDQQTSRLAWSFSQMFERERESFHIKTAWLLPSLTSFLSSITAGTKRWLTHEPGPHYRASGGPVTFPARPPVVRLCPPPGSSSGAATLRSHDLLCQPCWKSLHTHKGLGDINS